MLFKIALKNLLGARLRTFLNVFVTSISFFLIIFITGLYDGMRQHAKQVTIDTEVAGGAYWHPKYDPMDPMLFEDSHSILPPEIDALVQEKKAVPILVSQASIYPNGRIMPVIMKGIDPNQNIVNMPTGSLTKNKDINIPVLIGKGMANNAKLNIGDSFTIRWLDSDGTYDADEGTVVHIMNTENFKLDIGHIWIPLKKAQVMLAMNDEVTYVAYEKDVEKVKEAGSWIHRDVEYLIQDIEAAIEADKPGNQIMFAILLSLAAMGIFNAQVLSIFRRGKEIGTLMALGMTRSRVVALFTLEGGINAILAAGLTVFPFGLILWWTAKHGVPMPIDYSEMGLIIAKRIIPVYSLGLLFSTTIIIFTIVLVVSYLPSKRISKMKPTEALRGKTTA
jgi:ABC-type lipoprotein release transport system permease subunit|tara:strand:+ start:5648 stop:6823 length:1176 start_codon:yes stop_codon:yes gene_type:complete